MELVQDAWCPRKMTDLSICHLFQCPSSATQVVARPPATTSTSQVNAPAAGPRPFNGQRKLVIWFASTCPACQLVLNTQGQDGLTLVQRLQQAGPRASPPFDVEQIEWRDEFRPRFPHVRMVPLFDIVDPDPSAAEPTAYGPHTRVESLSYSPGQVEARLGV